MAHPLDNPVWNALATNHASFAEALGPIRRYRREYGPFAATEDGGLAGLARLAELARPGEEIYLQHADTLPELAGMRVARSARAVQMVADRIEGPDTEAAFLEMTGADAPEMLALARLTRPGPFAERTGALGRFIGIRVEGALVAMAGERMRPEGFTEVSGVCTHPDHRGRGHAAALMRAVARGILARGEVAFLHSYADNAGAIALYERLGFAVRRETMLVALEHL